MDIEREVEKTQEEQGDLGKEAAHATQKRT